MVSNLICFPIHMFTAQILTYHTCKISFTKPLPKVCTTPIKIPLAIEEFVAEKKHLRNHTILNSRSTLPLHPSQFNSMVHFILILPSIQDVKLLPMLY